jgi:hypothetical protein
MLFVLFETYTAAATALDDSHRFPTWEAKLGWCLFIVPCLLMTGLFLLLGGERGNIGFSLIGLSVLLYMAFMFLEDALGPEPMGHGDWVFTGIWIILCAVAIAAAWHFKRQLRSEPGE